MVVSKIKKHSPGYPSKEKTLNDPMLLKKVPERWKEIVVVCTALSAVTLSSCSNIKRIRSLDDLIKFLTPWSQSTRYEGGIAVPFYSLSEDEFFSALCKETYDAGNTALVATGENEEILWEQVRAFINVQRVQRVI